MSEGSVVFVELVRHDGVPVVVNVRQVVCVTPVTAADVPPPVFPPGNGHPVRPPAWTHLFLRGWAGEPLVVAHGFEEVRLLLDRLRGVHAP